MLGGEEQDIFIKSYKVGEIKVFNSCPKHKFYRRDSYSIILTELISLVWPWCTEITVLGYFCFVHGLLCETLRLFILYNNLGAWKGSQDRKYLGNVGRAEKIPQRTGISNKVVKTKNA